MNPLDPSNFPIPDPRLIEWTHDISRKKLYPTVADQLDMLFKDINAGLLGDAAKTGSFYQTILSVKEAHEKGSVYRPYADLPGPPESANNV